ncbi:hypothetical protein DFJ58DRAFT_848220 [Suillus subalutaceus]|uniref:uncharacterized protein n=1 Tax=Suillus subalutaceus TaxID=48586 RepID=UPI001B87E515|nr:uncharacterized protein DFJ58DRAFT_848220 [Suillus subalutaceus]KAG1831450.1 hypothetical protein DFJ58DRAFT_848220 [Suillus subalutaceus]
MTRLEAREHIIAKINKQQEEIAHPAMQQAPCKCTSPALHYHISKYARISYDITAWLSKLTGDPALKDFIPRLKDHLLGRIHGIDYAGDEQEFSDDDRSQVVLANNQLCEHSILRINYTTYDLRREQDLINPHTHADIMVLSHENDDDRHPYWYAWVVKIFHVNVWYYGPGSTNTQRPTRMDIVFVHWFGRDTSFKAASALWIQTK